MKLQTKLVAVKRISSSMARSSFSADDLEQAAHLIIHAEGIINPIILRQHSLESYEVIDGHFEYHAAVRAKEISLLKGETVQAIILEPDNEKYLLEQVNILRTAPRNSPPESAVVSEKSMVKEVGFNPNQFTGIEAQFINLERLFKSRFDELQKSHHHLELQIYKLSELVTENPKIPKIDISEEQIAQIANQVVASLQLSLSPLKSKQEDPTKAKPTKAKPTKAKPTNEIPTGFLLDLNTSSEAELAKLPGIRKGMPALIIQRRNTQGAFSRLEELSEIKSIGQETIKKLRNYLIV